MDGVAGGAAYFIARVAALDASHVRRLVQMAFETGTIRLGGGQARRIDDGCFLAGFGMLGAGTVARLAGSAFPSAALLRIHQLVRILLESVVDVFVTGLTGF
jgi:hypothetical protein